MESVREELKREREREMESVREVREKEGEM